MNRHRYLTIKDAGQRLLLQTFALAAAYTLGAGNAHPIWWAVVAVCGLPVALAPFRWDRKDASAQCGALSEACRRHCRHYDENAPRLDTGRSSE